MRDRPPFVGVAVAGAATLVLFTVVHAWNPPARLLVAPAWMFGAVISGDARHPNTFALWASLFLILLAIHYLLRRTQDGTQRGPSARRYVGLIVLYLVLCFEFVFFRPIGVFLLEATGQLGDVGSGFLLNMLLYLAPYFLVVAIATTLLYIRAADRDPANLIRTFCALLIGNVAALLASFAYYFARLAD